MPNEHHRNSQLIRAGRTSLSAILALASLFLLVLAGLPPATTRSAHADPKSAPLTSTLGAPPPRPSIALDFNNDGVLDTIRREMRSSDTAPLYSRFVVLSGADGAEFASFAGPLPNDLFGWFVTTPGDLDADGVEDFYVGAPDSPVGQPLMGTWGRTYFVSGATGATSELFAAPDRGVIGLGIVPLWDEDDDGLVDVAVGGLSPIETPEGADAGSGGVSANDEDPANPTIVLAHTQWWILSSATGDTLHSGEGRPPARLLNTGENGASFWASGAIAGERIWLDGVAGDLDGDGEVGMRDVTLLLQRMSASRDGAAPIDLDGDGRLDASDLGVLLEHFGDRRGRNPRLPRGAGVPVSFMGDGSGCGRNCHMECVDSDDCVNGGGGGDPGDGGGPPGGCSGGADCASGCDGNGNGIPDAQECGTPCYAGGSPNCDSDGDGTPDNQDCDSGGSNPCCQDSDNDGVSDQNEDDDCDGIPNGRDCDSPCFVGDPAACGDDDGDGIKNQDDEDWPGYVPRSLREENQCSPTMVLKSIRFGGPDYFPVHHDIGDQLAFGAPEWLDFNLDGDADDPPDHLYPTCFLAGVPVHISQVVIAITDGQAPNGVVHVTGRNSSTIEWTGVGQVVNQSIVCDELDSSAPLSGCVVCHDDFPIQWTVQFDEGEEQAVGTSAHPMYFVLDAPRTINIPLCVTPLHLACAGAVGMTVESPVEAIADAVFTQFTSVDVKRQQDGLPLRYYANWDTPIKSASGLLQERDGQCGAWCSLFCECLLALGVLPEEFAYVLLRPALENFSPVPAVADRRMLVKNWEFLGKGETNLPRDSSTEDRTVLPFPMGWNSPSFVPVSDNRWEYNWYWRWARDMDGLRGQNNVNPLSRFCNHQVVRVGNDYYDPSYGRAFTSIDSLNRFEMFAHGAHPAGSDPTAPEIYYLGSKSYINLESVEDVYPAIPVSPCSIGN